MAKQWKNFDKNLKKIAENIDDFDIDYDDMLTEMEESLERKMKSFKEYSQTDIDS